MILRENENKWTYVGIGIALLILILLPFVISGYWVRLLTSVFMFAVTAKAIDLMMGYTGYVPFGNVVFFGLVAYTTGILMSRGWPFIPGMLIGLLVFRDVCMAYMTGVFLVIPWLWFRTHDLNALFYAVFVNIIFAIAMIPEIKNWMRIKHEEKWDDPVEVIQLSGMGRGIVKMARKLGVLKKTEPRNADEEKKT